MSTRVTNAWKWLRRTVLALAALELAYVLVGNAFLRQDWGRELLSRKPEKLTASWQSAWTVVPGYVHVHGLELRGASVRVAWRVRLNRGTTLISLPSLLLRHLHFLAGEVRGAEVDVDLLPPPEHRRRYRWKRGWRVTLGGLHVRGLRRLRLGRFELSGNGSVRGWTRFQVRGPMVLRIQELRLEGAELANGGAVVARELNASASLSTTPYVPGRQPARELLRGLSGTAHVTAQADRLGFETADLRSEPWLGLNGSGRLELEIGVADGVVQPGSKLSLRGSSVAAEFFDFKATGSGRLEADVPEPGGRVHFGATFDKFHLARASDHARLLAGRGLEASFTATGSSIERPPSGIAGSIRLPPSRVADLVLLSPYLPPATGVTIASGSATVAAQLAFDNSTSGGGGRVQIDAQNVSATLGDATFDMDARVDAKVKDLDLVHGRADLSGSVVSIRHARIVRGGRLRTSDWHGVLRVRSGTIVPDPRASQRASTSPGPMHVTADVKAELLDSAPVVVMMEQRLPKLAWLHRVLTFRHVQATGDVDLRGPLMRLSEFHLIGGPKDQVEMRAELDLEGKKTSGVAYVRYRALDAAIALNRGDRDWRLRRARRVYEAEAASFRGGESPPKPN
jgi:hypothetical protein